MEILSLESNWNNMNSFEEVIWINNNKKRKEFL
jgi:hypothetical protein